MQLLERDQVVADVLADGRVRAAAGLDGADAIGASSAWLRIRNSASSLREDVVGHDAEADACRAARRQSASISAVLPLPDRPADADREARGAGSRARAARRARGRARGGRGARACAGARSRACVFSVAVRAARPEALRLVAPSRGLPGYGSGLKQPRIQPVVRAPARDRASGAVCATSSSGQRHRQRPACDRDRRRDPASSRCASAVPTMPEAHGGRRACRGRRRTGTAARAASRSTPSARSDAPKTGAWCRAPGSARTASHNARTAGAGKEPLDGAEQRAPLQRGWRGWRRGCARNASQSASSSRASPGSRERAGSERQRAVAGLRHGVAHERGRVRAAVAPRPAATRPRARPSARSRRSGKPESASCQSSQSVMSHRGQRVSRSVGTAVTFDEMIRCQLIRRQIHRFRTGSTAAPAAAPLAGLAAQHFAVGGDRVGLRIDRDARQRVVAASCRACRASRQPRTAADPLGQAVAAARCPPRATPARRTRATMAPVARPNAPNIGRMKTGCGVGMRRVRSRPSAPTR